LCSIPDKRNDKVKSSFEARDSAEKLCQRAKESCKEWCIQVLKNPTKSERQEKNRFRFWAPLEELDGRYLRVITLDDKITIHNAFPDRSFKP